MRARMWLIGALALTLAACTSVNRCKSETLLVTLTRKGPAVDGDMLRIEVLLAGGTPVTTELAIASGRAGGTIQVEFPSGYPEGQQVTVTVVSLLGGRELASGATSKVLGPGCDATDLLISAGDGGSGDLSGDDAATGFCAAMPGYCGAHGTCDNGPTGPVCTCATGYDGTRCTTCAMGYQDNDGNGTCTPGCATAGSMCKNGGTCSDTTGTVSCTCLPEFTGPDCSQCKSVPAKAIYLYNAGSNRVSDFMGRTGADARVTTALPPVLPGTGTATYRARGFLSITGDSIVDFPAHYCVPTTVPIYGIKADGTTTLLGPTWIDFTDGTIPATIGAALGYQDFNYFWTGSNNAFQANGHDCSGWTNTTDMNAAISNRSNVTTDWLNSLDNAGCGSGYFLLGLAYCVANCP